MAWPTEAGAIARHPSPRTRRATGVRRSRSHVVSPATFRGRHYHVARNYYSVFGAAEYRFYRSNSAPPVLSDTPYDTNATLPDTPTDVFADGTWFISVTFFNGLIESGFLPIGPAGETYLRLDVSGGEQIVSPPAGPGDWRLEQRTAGVVTVIGFYIQVGENRANKWSIARTFDGSTPATDTPDVELLMPALGLAIIEHDLPAQIEGATVKVRLQTMREDVTGDSFSESSEVKSTTALVDGPTAIEGADAWPGRAP